MRSKRFSHIFCMGHRALLRHIFCCCAVARRVRLLAAGRHSQRKCDARRAASCELSSSTFNAFTFTIQITLYEVPPRGTLELIFYGMNSVPPTDWVRLSDASPQTPARGFRMARSLLEATTPPLSTHRHVRAAAANRRTAHMGYEGRLTSWAVSRRAHRPHSLPHV